MTTHQVVIAGAGPTGLMLAGELALAGIDVAIVERRATQDLVGARAGGLHARTLEVLDQRGIAGRFLAAGQTAQVASFAGVRLDLTGFPTRHPYGLALYQQHIERLLLGWVEEFSVPILRGCEVTGFTQDAAGVDVILSDGPALRAEYLVGCDGGRSLVRRIAGIGFPGSEPTVSHLIAEVELVEAPQPRGGTDAIGLHSIGRLQFDIVDGKVVYGDSGPFRVMVTEREPGRASEPTLTDLSAAMTAHFGTDFGVHSPISISRFTDMARQAETYRNGRVLLAGDAAHIHYPAGGQGLNIGVQDAVNLGWKLAEVVQGTAPDTLLDSYTAERHPIAARVLRYTMASVALGRQDDRSRALSGIVTELAGFGAAKTHLAGLMSGLDVHYDFGRGHPLLGRRMPDLDVVTGAGSQRVFTLLHPARPLLLNFGAPGSIDIAAWADRVQLVDASFAGAWELPVIGTVLAPAAVLVRPDGCVAWVGDGTTHRLGDALATWVGPPAAT